MGAIAAGLQACRARIAEACREARRPPDAVRLLAVSKTFPAAAILEAYRAGHTVFGESYLQEALGKIAQVEAELAAETVGQTPPPPIEWHFIGPIQSNKTRPIAEHFDWVHSIDRLKVAQRLADARPVELGPLQVCIQVNVSGEASKHGIAPAEALDLARRVAGLPRLTLRGFMCIPAETSDRASQRAQFRVLAELLRGARAVVPSLDTLSMGMSGDLEAAILEGATLVRVGSAIFGRRDYGGRKPEQDEPI